MDGWNSWTADDGDLITVYGGLFRSAVRRLFSENLFILYMISNGFTGTSHVQLLLQVRLRGEDIVDRYQRLSNLSDESTLPMVSH